MEFFFKFSRTNFPIIYKIITYGYIKSRQRLFSPSYIAPFITHFSTPHHLILLKDNDFYPLCQIISEFFRKL